MDDVAGLLLSGDHIEEIAQHAHALTVRRFGRTIKLYAPVYISNECINGCSYCGFNAENDIERRTLTVAEAVREVEAVVAKGHRHVLLVSGEKPDAVDANRISSIARSVREMTAGISIEVQPMDEASYRELVRSGVSGVTLYQETYDEKTYGLMHRFGPKSSYGSRIEAIDAAGRAGMRFLGIGALLGLHDWRCEALSLTNHARQLMKKFWRAHVAISVPRIRDSASGFSMPCPVSDRELAHMICALRLSLPDCGISLSTREPSALRESLLPLGITQMSAGSVTSPGGYSQGKGKKDLEQFHIEDTRSPAEFAAMLKAMGYDAVWKDWERDLV
jgi:2-iminoacetate synthase